MPKKKKKKYYALVDGGTYNDDHAINVGDYRLLLQVVMSFFSKVVMSYELENQLINFSVAFHFVNCT